MITAQLFGAEHIETSDSDSDSWCTPHYVLDAVRSVLGQTIDLDPCSNSRSVVDARVQLTVAHDGLSYDWSQHRTVYCNPPYSDPSPWLLRCARHAETVQSGEAIALVKSDTSTKWWHSWVFGGHAKAICFPFRRINFIPPPGSEGKNGANFAVALVYYGHRRWIFEEGMAILGHTVML